MTLLLGSNVEGDFKLKPLLVYRSKNPQTLKKQAKGTPPVVWKAKSKVWVTAALFKAWFTQYFIPEIKQYYLKYNFNLESFTYSR